MSIGEIADYVSVQTAAPSRNWNRDFRRKLLSELLQNNIFNLAYDCILSDFLLEYSVLEKLDKSINLQECVFMEEIENLIEREKF